MSTLGRVIFFIAIGTVVYRSGHEVECIYFGAGPETAHGFPLRWDGIIATYLYIFLQMSFLSSSYVLYDVIYVFFMYVY